MIIRQSSNLYQFGRTLQSSCLKAIRRRTIVSAPLPGSGPLMSRRADRELPSLGTSRRWMRSIPIFILVMIGSSAAIFNYQKSSSSVVSSTLYSLRTNKKARQLLGDEVYFASKFPWISGELNQLQGRIDIQFWVKGTRQKALMRFKSERKHRTSMVSAVSFLYRRSIIVLSVI